MGPLTKVPCVKCLDNTSTPSAFLLTCRNCDKTWHHRCHAPPVQDSELVARIKAYNAGDFDNGIAGWRCRRCTKGKDTVVPPQQPSNASNSMMVDNVIEQPSKSLRGQFHAKSTRAKSTRSKTTIQPTTSHNPDVISHRDEVQATGFRKRKQEPLPPNRTTSSVPQLIDLTLSSDEETFQPPTMRPEPPHHNKPQSKALEHTTRPTQPGPPALTPSKIQTPPLSLQHRSPTPPPPPILPVQVEAHTPQINSPSPKPYPIPQTYEAPSERPAARDQTTAPVQHLPLEPESQAQPEPMNEIQPKPEPDAEPLPIRPIMTPWQTYNLAPSWILKGEQNPWETLRVKQLAPRQTLATKRKPVARPLGSGAEHGILFNFLSTTWLRTREEKTSSHLS